jgi:hypothetical protein
MRNGYDDGSVCEKGMEVSRRKCAIRDKFPGRLKQR